MKGTQPARPEYLPNECSRAAPTASFGDAAFGDPQNVAGDVTTLVYDPQRCGGSRTGQVTFPKKVTCRRRT